MSRKTETRVAIVGGGIVGTALGCALSGQGIENCLVEGREPERDWPEGVADLRVSALTKASQTILQNLGCWDEMVARAVSPYRDMKVWDCAGGGALHFDGAELHESVLGHIVENRVTVASLWSRYEQFSSSSTICPARVEALDNGENAARLKLSDGSSVEAELVIAADGRDSALRKMAGISVGGWEYDHAGLVATVRPENWHEETCYQRFLPEGGILAFLPLRDGTCSIVWSTSRNEAEELLKLDEPEFLERLTEASGQILGKVLEMGPRAAFPLRLQYANNYFKSRLVLAGDAAHALHPLAGQGANQGLLDAASLAEQLIDADKAGRSLAGVKTLRRYERWRKSDNYLMMGAMDGLKRVYGITFSPFEQIRSAGMDFVNRTVPLKNIFTRYAMGQHSDMPQLSIPEPSGL